MAITPTLPLTDPLYHEDTNTLADRLNICLKHRGISQTELAKGIGVTPQNIQALCSGKIKKSRYASEIAVYLNINAAWLATGKLPHGSNYITRITAMSQLPIISWEEIEHDSYNSENYVNSVFDHSDLSYALKVTDDSMSPKFERGDILLISKNKQAIVGDYVIAKILANEQYICRLLKSQTPLKLNAINPTYGTIEYSSSKFEILGIVKEVRGNLKQ